MRKASLFLFVLTICATAFGQQEVVIESFDRNGQMVFNRVTNAAEYRVEWAPTADGPWTNFTHIDLMMDSIPADGSGPITAAVPMVYRVVATVTNLPPPAPDYTIVNSGASAYTINGQSNPDLELTRGQTYTLEINSQGHPFWIKTVAVTGTGSTYTNGLSTNGVVSGLITFTVPMDAPDTLYYICQFHGAMQGVITIVGGTAPAPAGMSLIPAGEFVMGDTFGEGGSDELPLHTNYISAFYMDQYEVTQALWDVVKAFNGGNGYSYSNPGQGKATNHPVHTVNWYDVVKWCNARSQMDGLTPVYYTDAGFTAVYKTGEITPFANWSANGYRLPTEAEWEKAARGGVAGQRFPWGNTISHSNANYYAYPTGYSYDANPTEGSHPTYDDGNYPYTSPVGYFAPNGYGLYDMAGNVWEWCWDWYQSTYYASSPATDPRGPASPLSFRVVRGGSWGSIAADTRVADRVDNYPDLEYNPFGFRCARGL